MKRAASQHSINTRPARRPRLPDWSPNNHNVRGEIVEYAHQLQLHFEREENRIDLEYELRLEQLRHDYETIRAELGRRGRLRITDFLDPASRVANELPEIMEMVDFHRNLPTDPIQLARIGTRLRNHMQSELDNRVRFVPAARVFGELVLMHPRIENLFLAKVINKKTNANHPIFFANFNYFRLGHSQIIQSSAAVLT